MYDKNTRMSARLYMCGPYRGTEEKYESEIITRRNYTKSISRRLIPVAILVARHLHGDEAPGYSTTHHFLRPLPVALLYTGSEKHR